MSELFLDTSYIVALELLDDQNHAAAARHWRQLVAAPLTLVTTSYVFDEIVTFFNRHGLHGKAVQVGSSLLHSPSVRLVHVDEALFYEGWAFLRQHGDKAYSLTDCISFVVMERHSIRTAFTFDRHFIQAGFATEP